MDEDLEFDEPEPLPAWDQPQLAPPAVDRQPIEIDLSEGIVWPDAPKNAYAPIPLPALPRGKHLADLKRAMAEAVNPEDIFLVMRTLIEKCKLGDVNAIKLLFDRVLGKVPQSVEMTKEDIKTVRVGFQQLSDEELSNLTNLLAKGQLPFSGEQ